MACVLITPVKHTHTHTHLFNGPLSVITRVSRYQEGKTNLDFTEARDSECQWHQLGHMQVCTSLQTDNHASTPPLGFLQAGCSSCRPTSSVNALKALVTPVSPAKMATLQVSQFDSRKTMWAQRRNRVLHGDPYPPREGHF